MCMNMYRMKNLLCNYNMLIKGEDDKNLGIEILYKYNNIIYCVIVETMTNF